MTPQEANFYLLNSGLAFLPERMDTMEARAMLLAIGLQESKFYYREQIGGPAMGFWQFEPAGVGGVWEHHATKERVRLIVSRLNYANQTAVYLALRDNDPLAVVFARLLLWTYPGRLPTSDEPEEGWHQYLETWRPGRPREEDWLGNWEQAWSVFK